MASLYGTGTGVSLSGLQNNSYNDITADTATITTLNSTTGNITTLNTTTLTSTNVNSTNLTGTLQTASQPNITSVGTLPTATINTLTTSTIQQTGDINIKSNTLYINLTGNQRGDIQQYLGFVNDWFYYVRPFVMNSGDWLGLTFGKSDETGRSVVIKFEYQLSGASLFQLGFWNNEALFTINNSTNVSSFTSAGGVTNAGKFTSSSTADNAFLHSISTAQTYTKSFTALNSAITNGQNVQITFGKAQTTNNSVEIGHQYNGTTPASNLCTFGFYGNGPIMSYNQSGTITFNNFNIKPNTKEDATVSNSTQMGSVPTQTTLANITFTSNTQASYVCSASSNSSTAYRAFGTSASNWSSTSNIYDPAGVYTGTANIVSQNGTVVYGEYVQIQLPSSYVLKGASWTNTPDSNPSRALTYNIYGSASGSSGTWYLIHSGTTGGSSTTTVSNFDMISSFLFFVLQIKSMTDGGTGFNCTLNLDALTIVGFTYTQLLYTPQSLEIGDSTTASIPSDTLTVNGTSRFKGIVVSEDYTTLNGAVDGNANFALTGFLYKYKKICAKVSVENAGAITANTSFWASTRSPSITYDNTFTSGGVPTGYGMIITAGTYNGMYRAFYAGIYKVAINGRSADGVSSFYGVMPKTYNGTSFVNIFPNDGVAWTAPDGSNRRTFSLTFDISLASGTAVFLTTFAGTVSQSWATMSVEFVSST